MAKIWLNPCNRKTQTPPLLCLQILKGVLHIRIIHIIITYTVHISILLLLLVWEWAKQTNKPTNKQTCL